MSSPTNLPSAQPAPSVLSFLGAIARNLLAFLLSAGSFLWIYARIFADGSTDTFYLKVATPRAASLIVGSSRAGHGLHPSLIADGMLNFGFNILASPYGEIYFHAIERKLKQEDGGVFVVEVSPAALSHWMFREPREREDILGRLFIFSGNPNLNYLIRAYDEPLWKLPLPSEPRPGELPALVHPDGWTEVLEPPEPLPRETRIHDTLLYYNGILDRAKPAPYRIEWLRKTCEMLARRGRVLMVRLPVGEELRRLEEGYWPDFDAEMGRIASAAGVDYVSFVAPEQDALTTDGSHLTVEAGREISRRIARRLAETESEAGSALVLN